MRVERQPARDTLEKRIALVHREIFQLGALIALAILAFVVTRAVAASNREMNRRDASEWFSRGQQAMQAGQIDRAIESLRRATVRNHDDPQYVLALAHALALGHDDDGARAVLLSLRESDPEDRDVNLELARLAAARQDVTEALRFFHNTLYAPWPVEQSGARRAVRLELVRFLLAHQQTGRAVSELLAVSADLPDDAPLRLEVAQLFTAANDDAHALEQFRYALRVAPDNRTATAGAGLAAFRLGDYAGAQRYLHRLPADTDAVRATREVVDLVISRDPLATRIGSAERRRRLVDDIGHTNERLRACNATGGVQDDSVALEGEAQAFAAQLGPAGILEQDTVEAGVDLIDRIERALAVRCPPTTALDHALARIGRRHGADSK